MGRAPTPTVPPAPPSSAALALGTVRRLNSACPVQVLPEAEVQFCIPWRSQGVSAGPCRPSPLVLEACLHVSVRERVRYFSDLFHGSRLPPSGQTPIVAAASPADDSVLGRLWAVSGSD